MPKPRKPGAALVKTTLHMPPDLWRAAKIHAMDTGVDLRDVLLEALRRYLAETKKGARR
jgi:hypothetical protein